jgi:hypothetical protein
VTRPAKKSIWAAAMVASMIISAIGLPQSAASIIASSPAFSRSTRATSFSILARSSGGTRFHSL